MKKLSLLSLIGLAGLLAFLAAPIYAQEDDIDADYGYFIAETDDVDAEYEFNYGSDEENIALESVDDEIEIEGDADIEEINIAEDVDDSINDIIGFLDAGESPVIDTPNISRFELKIGDRDIYVNPATFFLSGIGLSILIGLIIWLILCHISLWRIFGRAGEGKWKSLIPLYNLYIVFKISGIKNWFWYILLVILIAAILSAIFPALQEKFSDYSGEFTSTVIIILGFLLAKKFGRGDSASILYALFSGIAVLILGFGDYKYQGNSKTEKDIIVEV